MDDKLRKTVLLMLSSKHAGEIEAARNAMLKIAEVDIHGLADAFSAALVPNNATGKTISYHQMARQCSDWNEIRGGLSEKESKFVSDMIGWRYPSDKQLDWLERIYRRMVGVG